MNNILFFAENGPIKWQNKAHLSIKQYLQSEISENTNLNQVIIQMELESINLSATNRTFVTKGEIESNFLFTHTDEPKSLGQYPTQPTSDSILVGVFKKLPSI